MVNKLLQIELQLEKKRIEYCKLYIASLIATGIDADKKKKCRCLEYENKLIFYISDQVDKEASVVSEILSAILEKRINNDRVQELYAEYLGLTNIEPINACIVQELIVESNKANIKTYFDEIKKYPLIMNSLSSSHDRTVKNLNKLIND